MKMRNLLSAMVAFMSLTIVNIQPVEAGNWSPWFLRYQNVSQDDLTEAFKTKEGTRKLFRVPRSTIAEAFRQLGLPVTEEELSAFVSSDNESVKVVECTDDRISRVKMGRVHKNGKFSIDYPRPKCYKGEKWLVWYDTSIKMWRAFLSLGCGNPIKENSPPVMEKDEEVAKAIPPESPQRCFSFYFEIRDRKSKSLVVREVILTTHIWGPPERIRRILIDDPCFKVWNKDRTKSWRAQRICDDCAATWERFSDNKLIAKRRGELPIDRFEVPIRGGAGWLTISSENLGYRERNPTELFFCSELDERIRTKKGKKGQGVSITYKDIESVWSSLGNPTSDPILFVHR